MKTKEEILNQLYVSPQDVKLLIPTLGMELCRQLVEETRNDMKEKNYFVPETKPKLALTKMLRKRIGV